VSFVIRAVGRHAAVVDPKCKQSILLCTSLVLKAIASTICLESLCSSTAACSALQQPRSHPTDCNRRAANMQDCPTGRLPRHSDGGSTLPPVATPKGGKKGSRRSKKGLGTISAPLTPHAGVNGPIDPRSPTQQQQPQQKQNQAAAASTSVTPSRLGRRNNTVSDTGHLQQPQQQPAVLTHSLSDKEHSRQNGSPDISIQSPGKVQLR
jgi:hypothetical protein